MLKEAYKISYNL